MQRRGFHRVRGVCGAGDGQKIKKLHFSMNLEGVSDAVLVNVRRRQVKA